MDQVKTAPADTTSEESCQQSSVFSPVTARYPYPHQPLFDDSCNEPHSKRAKLEEHTPCSVIRDQRTTSETSLHHFKGRTIPVGIAQPFFKDTQNCTTSSPLHSISTPEDEVDSLASDQDKQLFKDGQASKPSLSLALSHSLEIGSDSDDSNDSDRFNRFASENDPSHKVHDTFSVSYDRDSSDERDINTEEHAATNSRAIDNSDNIAIDNSHLRSTCVQKDMRPSLRPIERSSEQVAHSSIRGAFLLH